MKIMSLSEEDGMKAVNIYGQKIDPRSPCFIIAEAGVNHNGRLSLAYELVDAAREAGADAVKFQLFRTEEQVLPQTPAALYQYEHTGSENMYAMAGSYDLAWEKHVSIAEYCRKQGIFYMASCFDPLAVDFAKELGCGCIKIGSGEITNFPLLESAAASGLPVVLSTGMSSLYDVAWAVDYLNRCQVHSLVLMHCVSSYPASPEAMNLRAVITMSTAFGVPVGFSDHSSGTAIAAAAVAIGARVLEKHFTLDKGLPGPDHFMSLSPEELQDYVKTVRAVEAALGSGIKQPHHSELEMQTLARRSIVTTRPVMAGERLDVTNLTLKRAGSGIDPRNWEAVCGRAARVDIEAHVPLEWEMLW